MSTFDDRQKGYENKFAHDEELSFKVRAKRNKMLGAWVAARAGIEGDEAESYAKSIVEFAVDGIADKGLKERLLEDLREKGVAATENEVNIEFERLSFVAIEAFK